mmetsp:Transcript_23411/g.23822  ORF Transcript_23411/g.23822 Transcript_23411/m.23822 type:complete len:384 (-) Transcript_23411:333-1484(-)
MGKKDKKKKKNVDPNKKSELQAKKAAKADKSALKRLAKESRNSGDKTDGADAVNAEQPAAGAEDLDALIASFQTNRVSADAQDDVTEHVLPSGTYPPPRANFSLHSLEGSGSGSGSSGDWVLFGGEYYNGQENSVYNDCFHCASKRTQNEDTHTGSTPTASTWTRYQQDTAPHPRCAHSSFAYRNELYVWGGEIATSSQFFHHRDFWKYNPAGKRWTELTPAAASGTTKTKLKPNPPPSPRSGCATLVYRHYALFFGGFYEASTETKWYNDLHIYDLSTNVWSGAIQYDGTKLATTTGKIPGVRSNCVLGHFGDTAFLLGGFCKIGHQSQERGEENVHKAEGYIYGDVWSLNLKTLIAAYEHTTSNGNGNGSQSNPDSQKRWS